MPSAGQPVAALGASARLNQPGVLELEQDVLEELQRDVLGFREALALDGLPLGSRRHLECRAYGVVGFG
jgi:hypothetical protein